MNDQAAKKAWGEASRITKEIIANTLDGIQREVASRAYRASNKLRTASLFVLRGKRSGREYYVPGTNVKYKASAPGEPPAVRTGIFRLSWGTHVRLEESGSTYKAAYSIESNVRAGNYLLGEILENGTKHMDPRPYKQAVINRALPEINEMFSQPYKV